MLLSLVSGFNFSLSEVDQTSLVEKIPGKIWRFRCVAFPFHWVSQWFCLKKGVIKQCLSYILQCFKIFVILAYPYFLLKLSCQSSLPPPFFLISVLDSSVRPLNPSYMLSFFLTLVRMGQPLVRMFHCFAEYHI